MILTARTVPYVLAARPGHGAHRQQLANLSEGEAQPLGATDEAQPGDRVFWIEAVTGVTTRWLGDQPLALVEAHSLDADTRRFGNFPMVV